CATWDGFAYW
nr:immunoglobulin heavy chain junction region [Mus musculus]